MKSLLYVEIDLPRCKLNYGTSPCTASIPATGSRKCYNTTGTCQDRVNFDSETVTLRFGKAASYYPIDIPHLACLESVSSSGSTISLGENLGLRATITCSFRNMLHNDVGFDKYLSERTHDPLKNGTFWGRFRAREPYIQGAALRVIVGEVGQALEEMTVRHYVVESFSGPTPNGSFQIVARDLLKLADGDRAQAPRMSQGFLLTGINDSTTAATLTPVGIGDLAYPASGHINIGGKEICSFTRSGNTLTLVRGQMGTQASAHEAEERCQLVLTLTGNPAEIIQHLIVNYTDIPPEFIPFNSWELEVNTYLQRVYTANIAEPTSVELLVSELVEQAALAMWWDDIARLIRLQVLRNVPGGAGVIDESVIEEGSLNVQEQHNKRISQVWTYYALINPLKSVTDTDNYLSSAVRNGETADVAYQLPAIKKIMSRWIPAGGRSTALRVNEIQLGRFVRPPRKISFALFRKSAEVELGRGYLINSRTFEDDEGTVANVPVQITNLNFSERGLQAEAQEVLFTNFDPEDLSDRIIIFEVPERNINLRARHDLIYPAPTAGDVGNISVTFIISENVTIGSASNSQFSVDVGDWPAGLVPKIINHGRIIGKGGDGGPGISGSRGGPGRPGLDGGWALCARTPVDLENNGTIAGGGGGGGGGRCYRSGNTLFNGGNGGGGGGDSPGAGATNGGQTSAGQPGTDTEGGAGGGAQGVDAPNRRGGRGGDLGQDGVTGGQSGGNQGLAGGAIDGASFINFTASGTIIGAQIN